jgi:hypothetical protein
VAGIIAIIGIIIDWLEFQAFKELDDCAKRCEVQLVLKLDGFGVGILRYLSHNL